MALLKGAKERGESYSEFFLFHHTPTHSIFSTSLPFYLSFFPPCSIQSHLSSTIPSLPFIFFPFLHASPISLNAIPFPHPISSSPITSHPLSFLLSLPSLPPLRLPYPILPVFPIHSLSSLLTPGVVVPASTLILSGDWAVMRTWLHHLIEWDIGSEGLFCFCLLEGKNSAESLDRSLLRKG